MTYFGTLTSNSELGNQGEHSGDRLRLLNTDLLKICLGFAGNHRPLIFFVDEHFLKDKESKERQVGLVQSFTLDSELLESLAYCRIFALVSLDALAQSLTRI